MSYIGEKNGKVYAPGWFLADDEHCTRETRNIPQSMGVNGTDGKYVPMGTVYPAVGSSAEGIVYEDVDVTNGASAGSVVTGGTIIAARIPLAETQLTASTITALQGKGLKLLMGSEPAVTRPY